jgi:hypothetical protein
MVGGVKARCEGMILLTFLHSWLVDQGMFALGAALNGAFGWNSPRGQSSL